MFVTDSDVQAAVIEQIKKKADAEAENGEDQEAEEAAVLANLSALITRATNSAYQQILQRFAELGYTSAQADTWGMGHDVQLNLARYQVLIDNQGDSADIGEWRKELDYWRQYLKDTTVLPNPDGNDPAVGKVGFGDLSTTRDRFVLDPDDSRIGRPTEW